MLNFAVSLKQDKLKHNRMGCDIVDSGFGVKLATGITHCRLCSERLLKGQPVIYVSDYKTMGQVHILPEHCEYLTKRLLYWDVIE